MNVVILLGASFFIVYEAVHRFYHQHSVLSNVVILLACVGIAGNGLSALLLHRGSEHNINVRGAFLHMVGDLLTSVAVLATGIIFIFRPWYWLDPLLSLLIVIFILKNCYSILKEASIILMDATPHGINIQEIKRYLESIPGVQGAHYFHVWNLNASSVALSCHIQVADQPLSNTETLAEIIRKELLERFGIDHPVLQFETGECGTGGLLCEVSCSTPQKARVRQ